MLSRFLSRLTTTTGIVSTVVALLAGLAFFKLGLWQLSRADEKTAIMQQHLAATEMPPLSVLPEDASSILYRRVKLSGRFDTEHQFLLDNRTVAGQAGFEVITPFLMADNQYVLINRGWIGHNGDRRVLLSEDTALDDAATEVQGIVVSPSRGIVIGNFTGQYAGKTGADSSVTEWPVILQFVDYETIAAKLDKIPVLDAVIIAAEGQIGNYAYNWKPVGGKVQIHLGYAFQWFAMLAALVVLYVYLMVFRKNNE